MKLGKNNIRSTCLRLKGCGWKPGNINELLEGGICSVAATEVNIDRVYAVCVNDKEILVSWLCKGAGLAMRVSQLTSKTKLR